MRIPITDADKNVAINLSSENPSLLFGFKLFAQVASIATMVIGIAVLVGWRLNFSALKSGLPGLPSIQPLTAVMFIFAGISLNLQVKQRASQWRKVAALATAWLIVLISGSVFAEYLFQIDLHTTQMLFANSFPLGETPARPSPLTVIAFLCAGSALIILDKCSRSGGYPAEWLALIAGLISLLGVVGYLYNVPQFYKIAHYTSLAAFTAVGLALLTLAVLAARPDRGLVSRVASSGMSGDMARRLLPTAVLVPLLLGWLRLRGQQAGWYGTEFGLALHTTSNVIVFVALVWWNAGRLQQIDAQRSLAKEKLRLANENLETLVMERTKDLGDTNVALLNQIGLQQQTEQELRATQEKFRSVAETANDAIVSANSEGNITYFNPAAERMFGYTADAIKNQPLSRLMPDRFHAAHLHGFERFLTTGRSQLMGTSVELVGKKADGSEFPVELSLSSWKIGGKIFVTGILRDIAERKSGEREILALNARLARRATELETVNREIEAFSYSVSHDLRAPLRAINGFCTVLSEDYASKLDEQGQHYLSRVRTASHRMGELIDDLLQLSRLTRDKFHFEQVNLSDLAQTVEAELRQTDSDRQVEFVIMPNMGGWGDAHMLRIVLDNLLGNAWKFTTNTANAHIQFSAQQLDGETVFCVRDNGVGFDMAYADKLFGVFQRLHGANEFPGTGVGLATVQRVIHRHGGRIWAEAELNRGATFYFTLPPHTKI